LKNGSEITILE